MIKKLTILFALVLVSACAQTNLKPFDYTSFRSSEPQSMLVVPVINHSNEPEAADFFLTTLPFHLAEKGYYVFPANMVKRSMEADGLSDASLVHSADPARLGSLFNTDTIMYVDILKWESNYVVLSSNVTVGFRYTLKSAITGETLWWNEQEFTQSTSSSSGNFLADLVVNAIAGAIDSMKSDYTPIANAANTLAITSIGRGIPNGPYSPLHRQDVEDYPSTGTGFMGKDDDIETENITDNDTTENNN